MRTRLFVVHGSHPCRTVQRALELKGVPFSLVELPPLAHAAIQRALFGARTVPGIRFADGEKLSGSRRIVARLEEMVPEPALLPAEPAARQRVLEAERWGDEVLQPIARRVLWPALKARPSAAPSYTEGGKIALPAAVQRAAIPLIARGEIALNKASDAALADDLRALPGHLDRIDAWIADGTLSAPPVEGTPNRADLQIAPTLALLMTLEDLRPAIAPRPAGQLAAALFGDWAGSVPAGTLPAGALPAPAAPASV
jgi:glutathione S-transferase